MDMVEHQGCIEMTDAAGKTGHFRFSFFSSFYRRPTVHVVYQLPKIKGTQREYSSKPLKHSIVKRILVFKG